MVFRSNCSLLLGTKVQLVVSYTVIKAQVVFLCLLLINLLLLANLKKKSIHEKLDCFLKVENNMLKEDNLVDEAVRDIFALFWKTTPLLVEKALSCF